MKKYKDMTYSINSKGLLYKNMSINGKRNCIYASSPQELYKKYIELLSLKTKGLTPNSSIYMRDWSNFWLKNYKENKTEKATYNMYESIIRLYINPQLGTMQLKNIKELDIVQMLNLLANKPRQQKKVLLTVKQILNSAIDNDYIYKNVAKNIKLPPYKSKEKKALTQDEIYYVKLAANEDYYCFMVYFMIYTGLRKEEVSALNWSDFDFNSKTIYIHQAIHWEHNRPELKDTKNKENCYIPIYDVIYNRLLKEYNNRKSNIVFPMKTNPNKYMTDIAMRRVLESSLKYINKIKQEKKPNSETIKFSYHTLRHTYACLLHKAGIPLKEAQKLTRHKNSRVLLDIYTHLDEEDNNNAINKFNNTYK